ncbi:3-deoxy-7-phosphoheptulonate synthase [Candidatus Aalborgicola defluviihabitans]|jgi:3-deoxy-7-phosphoheptulonate synthase|uniref:3-deoxy-7-phosphoheptulonate synthase n=1 Tax=Candidatus Aalborgicola defluviihabitans TaxID=3386187 RepID=UPI001E1A90A6|nr:3-deoxy-7-phosphoheptulonate synthase [Burkholderiales bacterium]MBK6569221.1 3-deoxy-7-phosphoheptulonate synthase [Burkholderiales bacterium]MBK7280650.1 3-deoxy-7-phosphoheptulonate synthase [Burkholderiales bacterium]
MPLTSDIRIRSVRPLISPAILEDELPLPAAAETFIQSARQQIARIILGQDDRLLAVVGPCSVHDPVSALEYARKLAPLATRLSPDLLVVMRVYFEKPRTVVGWKGLINDPGLDGSFQINRGLRLARQLLLDVTAQGLPIATEFLDTTLGQYYADLVSWGAIGARTTESQIHRELASGLSMPVGFKNRTDGDLQVAVDAILSAQHPHCFPSLTHQGAPAVLTTAGNPHGHLVLRGGSRSGPNFGAEHVAQAAALLQQAGAPQAVLVDCSHANSGKRFDRQPEVAHDVAGQVAAGQRAIIGVMLESHLVAGTQSVKPGQPLTYGQSITDACLAFDDVVPVLEDLAQAVRQRRQG